MQQRSAIEREGDVFEIGDHFIEPRLLLAAAHAHLLHDGADHHLEHLVVALVEVLLLVVELIEHDLEVRPRGTASLKEPEHALQEKPPPPLHASLVDRLDLLQQENPLLGALLLEVNLKQLVLPQPQEGAYPHEMLLLRGVEGAEGEVQRLVEAKPASEVLGQHRVVLLNEADQLLQLLPLERLPQQLLVQQNEEGLRARRLQLLLEGAPRICEHAVAVPLVDFEELALGKLLQAAPVLKSGVVLEDEVVLSLPQVHARPHSSFQLLLLGGVPGEQFWDGFDELEQVLPEVACDLGQDLVVLEPEDEGELGQQGPDLDEKEVFVPLEKEGGEQLVEVLEQLHPREVVVVLDVHAQRKRLPAGRLHPPKHPVLAKQEVAGRKLPQRVHLHLRGAHPRLEHGQAALHHLDQLAVAERGLLQLGLDLPRDHLVVLRGDEQLVVPATGPPRALPQLQVRRIQGEPHLQRHLDVVLQPLPVRPLHLRRRGRVDLVDLGADRHLVPHGKPEIELRTLLGPRLLEKEDEVGAELFDVQEIGAGGLG